MSEYGVFLNRKSQFGEDCGFAPVWMPEQAFPHQEYMIDWHTRKGRGAGFLDCGMGKSLVIESFAENVVRKTNGRFLILDPLAVTPQMVAEGSKFGIEVKRCSDGKVSGPGIYVTNYERLHHFDPNDFIGAACDESGILKSFDGVFRSNITEFMKKMPYRQLSTATPAPNDYFELGTSSEALGHIGYMDVLNRFFKNNLNNSASGRMNGKVIQWRFKGHAEEPFWQYVCSWARVARRPSDLGFEDGPFILPELVENTHIIKTTEAREGFLFPMEAVGMGEQREERRLTLRQRCEKLASLSAQYPYSLIFCDLNDEGNLLEKLIPDCVQVSGRDDDDAKEEKLTAFARGEIKRLVTKWKIGAWGLNLQHCPHVGCFVTHSFESRWQGIRRCWRFGQKNTVTVDTVLTEGECLILQNQQRKSDQAAHMFGSLVAKMNEQLHLNRAQTFNVNEEIPTWL